MPKLEKPIEKADDEGNEGYPTCHLTCMISPWLVFGWLLSTVCFFLFWLRDCGSGRSGHGWDHRLSAVLVTWIVAEVILFYSLGFTFFYPLIGGIGVLTIVLSYLPSTTEYTSSKARQNLVD
jgi:hypothetical protein